MENSIRATANSDYGDVADTPQSDLFVSLHFWGLRKRLRNGLASFQNSRYVDLERIVHKWRFE